MRIPAAMSLLSSADEVEFESMRLAYLSASLIPSRSANSVHVMKMCSAFVNNGHEVTLYARQGQGDKVHDAYGSSPFQLELIPSPKMPGIGAAHYAYRVHRRLIKARSDILYARHVYSLWSARRMGVPLIYEAHTPPGNRVQHLVERNLFARPNFARLVVITAALRDWYLENCRELRSHQVLVAHDGADEYASEACEVKSDSARFQVGYVGQLYPGKGMEIISQLPHLLPQMDFHVIGGTEKDLSYWKGRIQASNLKFHGFVPHAQIALRIRTFDAVLAPYQNHVHAYGSSRNIAKWMSPLKLFEYMAAKRPIVASDMPVLREILIDGHNSLLVGPTESAQWVEALQRLADSPELRASIAEKAYQEFVQKYTWRSRAVNVLSNLY